MPSIVFIFIILFISTSKAILNTTNDYFSTTEGDLNETDFINNFDLLDTLTFLDFDTKENFSTEHLILNDIQNKNEVNETNTEENTTDFSEENNGFDNKKSDSQIISKNGTENTTNESVPGNDTNSEEDNAFTTPKIKNCVPRSICYKDEDCGEKNEKTNSRPRCLGIFPGTCDCTACISGLHCLNQTSCGGLYNSCENETGICKCIEAHKLNGFANYGEALLKFCNKQKCNGELDTCFGLPCRRGRCFCY
uniref:Uncharacterized protein n=1 Tax=Meloidogyne enterolobii TaxID=390850 RepID=A0A6V7U4G4_MELEN|nr:unnamed protein product [Meloidogyne enterolobii]